MGMASRMGIGCSVEHIKLPCQRPRKPRRYVPETCHNICEGMKRNDGNRKEETEPEMNGNQRMGTISCENKVRAQGGLLPSGSKSDGKNWVS